MIRQIIHIDEEKCNGCGLCASACHEGAIAMVDGVAKLIRDDYCDGMGDCLPACPTGAITFEEREAAEYDRAAVEARMASGGAKILDAVKLHMDKNSGGCPGSRIMNIVHDAAETAENVLERAGIVHPGPVVAAPVAPVAPVVQSQLTNWPVQIKLAPVQAPYFNGAKLLIAADCTAFAYGNFHNEFLRGKVALIGCPKLDAVDYSEKLETIIRNNDIQSVTIVRMQVPCCGGLAMAAQRALQASGKFIPWQIVTIGMDGKVLD